MPSSSIEISGTEWHLAHTFLLNVLVLASLWRYSRRCRVCSFTDQMPRILLGWFLVQYISVLGPALLGLCNRWSMTAVALTISGILCFFHKPAASSITITVDEKLGRSTL